jgi:hypothetical protein
LEEKRCRESLEKVTKTEREQLGMGKGVGEGMVGMGEGGDGRPQTSKGTTNEEPVMELEKKGPEKSVSDHLKLKII